MLRPAMAPPEQAERQDLATKHLGRADRRDPEELDDAARSLAHEGQRDEGDGQVLEDERQHGGSEVRDHARFGRRLVDDLRARRGRDDGWRDRRGVRLAGGDRVALALRRRPLDDRPIDGTRQTRGEEAGIVDRDRVDGIDLDLDDRLLAGIERGVGVFGGDDQHIGLAVREAGLTGRPILGDLSDMQSATGEFLVARDVRRESARQRRHDDRLERPFDAAVAEPEEGHDEERAHDQAHDRPGPSDRLDELLADEREESEDDRKHGTHQAAAFAGSVA